MEYHKAHDKNRSVCVCVWLVPKAMITHKRVSHSNQFTRTHCHSMSIGFIFVYNRYTVYYIQILFYIGELFGFVLMLRYYFFLLGARLKYIKFALPIYVVQIEFRTFLFNTSTKRNYRCLILLRILSVFSNFS